LTVGARNVLASIWPVPDSEEVRDIMVDFHAALRDGSAPSLAFRSAIKQGVSPYYWGGFSVYGT